ncbi:hypothetical protein Tco_0308468 [Tanacetum coccineum]
MDDPNITMEEYIRLEEEKDHRSGNIYNWETATYGKIWYDEDVHDLRSVEIEFLAIVFNDSLTSEVALSRESMVSPVNDNQIDFRISFDESDDEVYTLDFSEPTISPQHIDEFDETMLSEYDGEEQNVIYFNDLFPFNVIYPDDLSDKHNDDDKINIKQSSGDNVINTDVGAYAQGSNKLLETRPRWKEIDNVVEVSIIWNSCSLKQHGESTEQISGEFPNTGGKQEKERRTCGDCLKYEESRVRIKCESILNMKKSNYSSFQVLRSSCNEDMVKYEDPLPSTTRARALNERSNKKIPPATSQPPGWRVCRPAEGMPPGRRLCRPALGAHVCHFTLEET